MRAAVLLVVLCASTAAHAHGSRMGSLRVDELDATHATAEWTTTVPGASAQPRFLDCTAERVAAAVYTLACPRGLRGAALAIDGLGAVVGEATVFVRFCDGTSASHLVSAGDPTWQIPAAGTGLEVAGDYVGLGLVHIATGADHLLFLVLLALLLRRPRDVLLAETAFTLSHSLSFAATSLGWIHVPAAPAEACIALSLVLLALDVGPRPTATRMTGVALAFAFGFVHGLGFAGGLHELGVPDAHAAAALVGFGAGVELGQVAFLACVLVVLALAQRWRHFPRAVPVFVTLVGGLATAWLIERLLAL